MERNAKRIVFLWRFIFPVILVDLRRTVLDNCYPPCTGSAGNTYNARIQSFCCNDAVFASKMIQGDTRGGIVGCNYKILLGISLLSLVVPDIASRMLILWKLMSSSFLFFYRFRLKFAALFTLPHYCTTVSTHFSSFSCPSFNFRHFRASAV